MMVNDNHALNPATMKRLPYDSVKDFKMIGFVGYTPMYSTAVWTGHPLSRDSTGFGGPTPRFQPG